MRNTNGVLTGEIEEIKSALLELTLNDPQYPQNTARGNVARALLNKEAEDNNFVKLALQKIASRIFEETKKTQGKAGENYEATKRTLIENASHGLFTELLIDGCTEEVFKAILSSSGLTSDQITGLLRFDTPARAFIITAAKHALRHSMRNAEEVIFNEARLNLSITEAAKAIKIKIGANQAWWRAGTEEESIAAADTLLASDPGEYVKNLINASSQLDLQKEEVARQILRAARLDCPRIDALLANDTPERKNIFAIAKRVIEQTCGNEKDKAPQAKPIVESVREQYINKAADGIIGRVGLENEGFWTQGVWTMFPRAAYPMLSENDKIIASRCAASLYDKEVTHDSYQTSVVNSLHKGNVSNYVDMSSTSFQLNLLNIVGAGTIAKYAIYNASSISAAVSTLSPLMLAGVAASFAYMTYSRWADNGSNENSAWRTTVAPMIVMGMCCPSAAAFCTVAGFSSGAFKFNGNQGPQGLKIYPDTPLSMVASAILLFAASSAPMTNMALTTLAAGAAISLLSATTTAAATPTASANSWLKEYGASHYPKEGLSPSSLGGI